MSRTDRAGINTLRPACYIRGVAEIISFGRRSGAADDTLWAVVASVGRRNRVAEIYPSRLAALADRDWREAQVRAHASFLQNCLQPAPRYSVAPVRRSDLPKGWTPLPALGFLRGAVF